MTTPTKPPAPSPRQDPEPAPSDPEGIEGIRCPACGKGIVLATCDNPECHETWVGLRSAKALDKRHEEGRCPPGSCARCGAAGSSAPRPMEAPWPKPPEGPALSRDEDAAEGHADDPGDPRLDMTRHLARAREEGRREGIEDLADAVKETSFAERFRVSQWIRYEYAPRALTSRGGGSRADK